MTERRKKDELKAIIFKSIIGGRNINEDKIIHFHQDGTWSFRDLSEEEKIKSMCWFLFSEVIELVTDRISQIGIGLVEAVDSIDEFFEQGTKWSKDE